MACLRKSCQIYNKDGVIKERCEAKIMPYSETEVGVVTLLWTLTVETPGFIQSGWGFSTLTLSGLKTLSF
ncbi:hypothetical protein PLAN_30039 [Planktothrix rubescens CCAP 1459/22]|uniref:Uncharacterized protein n=1 Tax=Planktothrix rubescens CCAP 1459/22 TaxID=329571 RepID=A0A6J7ZKB5_PLARU|nr:hypothetical protein PLAN_30039 [Planktothrix rubescens NIVA-CYA 18]